MKILQSRLGFLINVFIYLFIFCMKQIMFDLLLCSAAMHGRFAGIIPLFFQWFARLLNTLKIPRIGPNAALSPADEMGVTSTKP